MQSNLKSCNVISLNTYINEKLRVFSLCIVRFREDLVRVNLSLGIPFESSITHMCLHCMHILEE